MARVLVLGGTAWLGRHVAQAAVAREHEVTCLARGESGDVAAGATLVRGDRAAVEAYEPLADTRWDLVVDVAREPRQVRTAVEALGHLASRWTFVSTGSVYADQSRPLTEDSPLLPPDPDAASPERYGEGKVACEDDVRRLRHHLVVRAGLVTGPGDPSDRYGYYASRMLLAQDGPVLVPDVPDQPAQVVDVRDLAAWLVSASLDGVGGVVHGVGEQTTVGAVLELSRTLAGHAGDVVPAAPDWLRAHDVEEWAGPRSLPLWLPDTHVGMGLMGTDRALEHGLVPRPLEETLTAVLDDERERGLDRQRRAGLTRDDELALLDELDT